MDKRLLMSDYKRANEALFSGDRSEILAAVEGMPESNHKLWLLACASDDEKERQLLLQQVAQSREQPYASLAREILEREAAFANEIARIPRWQMWIAKNSHLLRLFSVLLGVAILALL